MDTATTPPKASPDGSPSSQPQTFSKKSPLKPPPQINTNPTTTTANNNNTKARRDHRAYRILQQIKTKTANPKNPTQPTTTQWKYCSREVAALNFLSVIPMKAENDILANVVHTKQDSSTFAAISAALEEHTEKKTIIDTVDSEILNKNEDPNDNDENNPDPNGDNRKWWEKLFFTEFAKQKKDEEIEMAELDAPDAAKPEDEVSDHSTPNPTNPLALLQTTAQAPRVVPARRLHGIPATILSTPLGLRSTGSHSAPNRLQLQKESAKAVRLKQWEMKVAHGVAPINADDKTDNKALLDGRIFFSSKQSYPAMVFSTIKYEPRKEEAMRRRKKIEEMGGGGRMYFAIENRDWRGTSYRSITFEIEGELKVAKKQREMNRKMRIRKKKKLREKNERRRENKNKKKSNSVRSNQSSSDDSDNNSSNSSSSSDGNDSDEYHPGFLDDPNVVHGRHRHTLIGDKLVGPIVSSTIQFVRPAALKAELNKQFRERFDGWEPPRSKWKYIGAKAVNGVYTLIDPSGVGGDDNETDRKQVRCILPA
ncbi:hypothetical protein TL16_g09180 [Triparma laevis f. inornata]|uniref:Uncharacterized protein n=1 Tax=Triparma laevis f. inornata TaxID=1714386 RepID=A0A9W7B505_9STRA|nr:hypothetical protein TL16_g09180 [Triparma laevis f. inornata]